MISIIIMIPSGELANADCLRDHPFDHLASLVVIRKWGFSLWWPWRTLILRLMTMMIQPANWLFNIFAWQKIISKHRVVETAGRLRPAFLEGLSLTKDRSICNSIIYWFDRVDNDDQTCAATDDNDLHYLMAFWSVFCSSSSSDSLTVKNQSNVVFHIQS